MVNVLLKPAEEDKFTSMARQMGRWMDQVLGQSFRHLRGSGLWRPAVNLCEDDTQYCVVVDLAGIKPTELDLKAENGVLHVTGERVMPEAIEHTGQVRVHLMEIDHGRFARSIDLPPNVNVDKIEAFYRNGFLWVRIPKTD